MCTRSIIFGAAAALFLLFPGPSRSQAVEHYGFGSPASPEDLSKYFAIQPDGHGLPPGSGTAQTGAQLFAERCTACHGEHLEGNPTRGIGGNKLLGGRGTINTKTPVKTVESYWPYATTLFDYIKRAMPMNAPGSLSNDEVYSLTAYILSKAKIIQPDDTVNASTLPNVEMPNRDGFFPDPRPEVQLYH